MDKNQILDFLWPQKVSVDLIGPLNFQKKENIFLLKKLKVFFLKIEKYIFLKIEKIFKNPKLLKIDYILAARRVNPRSSLYS
jgi:hypothetical protein